MIDWLPSILKGIGDARVADVLREKVDLLDLQRAQAVAERDALSTQLAQARLKIETLESEKADLQGQLNDTCQQMQRLQQPGDKLPEESEKMLVVLANDTGGRVTSDKLIRHLQLPQAKGDYFFDQLVERKFVAHSSGQMGVGWFWYVTKAGREYMAKHGLL